MIIFEIQKSTYKLVLSNLSLLSYQLIRHINIITYYFFNFIWIDLLLFYINLLLNMFCCCAIYYLMLHCIKIIHLFIINLIINVFWRERKVIELIEFDYNLDTVELMNYENWTNYMNRPIREEVIRVRNKFTGESKVRQSNNEKWFGSTILVLIHLVPTSVSIHCQSYLLMITK